MIKINDMTGIPTWAIILRTTLRILTALIILIVIPLIVINLTFIFQKDDRVPSFMGYSMLNVISGSMEGTIDVRGYGDYKAH